MIIQSINPSNGNIVWEGPSQTAEEVANSISNARSAFRDWSNTALEERISLCRQFAEKLEEHKEAMADLISKEVGKPRWEAATEVGAMIAKVDISIKAHKERCSPFQSGPGITRYKPHGVLAVFGPFNFPGHLPNGHICPALIAGNTIVFKPSELAPAVAERYVEIWKEAGLPTGVLNIVQGGIPVGEAILDNIELDGVLFTGSGRVGKLIAQKMAAYPGKILALEMGGNNPLLVHEVENLEAAALMTVQSAYLTAGQRCTCARRLILTDIMADKFLPVLEEWISRVRVGTPESEPEPFMGPVISERAAKAVIEKQSELIQMGAKSIVPAKLLKEGTGLVSPALLDCSDVENLSDEECFGPLLQIRRVENFEAAIEEANRTAYGLSAGLISDSKRAYEQFYQKARAGIINWNQQLTGASSAAPFGGIGDSGNHRPSAFFAADYCSYPIASIEKDSISLPDQLPPGL